MRRIISEVSNFLPARSVDNSATVPRPTYLQKGGFSPSPDDLTGANRAVRMLDSSQYPCPRCGLSQIWTLSISLVDN